MTPSEAFALLGVPENANEDAVKEAYRRQSMRKHPDRSGGSAEDQSLLNEAYSVAVAALRPENVLVLRTADSVERVESALLVERSARQAEGAAKIIKRRRTSRLHRLRNVSLLAGAVAGFSFLLSDYLLEPVLEVASEGLRRAIKLQLGVVTVSLGAWALWIQTRVQRLESAIEACLEDLSDRKLCAERLAALLGYQDKAVVSEVEIGGDLIDGPAAIGPMRVTFVFDIHLRDEEIRRLLVPKAVEHRLLLPIEPDRVDIGAEARYQVLFRPSGFKPQPQPPPEPPRPMSAKEAREMALAGILVALTFGSLTTYLAVFRRTWWAILPGLPALGGAMLMLVGLGSWLVPTRCTGGRPRPD